MKVIIEAKNKMRIICHRIGIWMRCSLKWVGNFDLKYNMRDIMTTLRRTNGNLVSIIRNSHFLPQIKFEQHSSNGRRSENYQKWKLVIVRWCLVFSGESVSQLVCLSFHISFNFSFHISFKIKINPSLSLLSRQFLESFGQQFVRIDVFHERTKMFLANLQNVIWMKRFKRQASKLNM